MDLWNPETIPATIDSRKHCPAVLLAGAFATLGEQVTGNGTTRKSSLRIALAHNLRRADEETQAELLGEEYVELLRDTLAGLGHEVVPVEMSGPPTVIVDRLLEARPQLVFNVAEGTEIPRREPYFPAIYEVLGLAYTGGGPALLYVGLDKRLIEKVFSVHGIRVPRGSLVTPDDSDLPDELDFPLFVKPNYEGSSKGIHRESLVETREEASDVIGKLLSEYPDGVNVEEFIPGRELTVPMLEEYPGHVVEVVEYWFKDDEHNIFDYERKSAGDKERFMETRCPPELEGGLREIVLTQASRAFDVARIRDCARADFRLREDGTPFLLEVNALPGLREESPTTVACRSKGLEYAEMIDLIVRSARKRYRL